MRKEVTKWLRQWNQENHPELYHFYRTENGFGYVLGECFGIAIIPRGYNDNALMYLPLGEDDEFYFIQEKNFEKHTYWMEDAIKCLQVAKDYLEKHATPACFSNSKTPCGWQLPWKDEVNDENE